ncbi:MAG: DUF6089 family protein [Bacteroidia bacterium]
MKKVNIMICGFVLLLGTLPTFAQKSLMQSISFGLGTAYYLGDVAQTPEMLKPGGAVAYTRYLTPILAGRLGMFYSGYAASDSAGTNKNRGIQFKSPLWETSAVLMVDLLGKRNAKANNNTFFSPYLYGGIALFSFNPQGKIGDKWYNLQPLGTEGQFILKDKYPKPYKQVQFALPVGLGFQYKFSRQWGLNFDVGFRKTFTDYMDDVSGSYPNKVDLLAFSGPEAVYLSDPTGINEQGKPRGDNQKTDSYIFTHLSLVFYPSRRVCPAFGKKK